MSTGCVVDAGPPHPPPGHSFVRHSAPLATQMYGSYDASGTWLVVVRRLGRHPPKTRGGRTYPHLEKGS